MSRNRKRQTAALRFGPLLWALLFCILVSGASVGYVWQKDQIRKLGQQIKVLENRHAEMVQRNKQRSDALAAMRTQAFINRQVESLKLGLVEAQPSQFWRLKEPSLAPEKSRTAAEYAAHSEVGAR